MNRRSFLTTLLASTPLSLTHILAQQTEAKKDSWETDIYGKFPLKQYLPEGLREAFAAVTTDGYELRTIDSVNVHTLLTRQDLVMESGYYHMFNVDLEFIRKDKIDHYNTHILFYKPGEGAAILSFNAHGAHGSGLGEKATKRLFEKAVAAIEKAFNNPSDQFKTIY